jgi:hypothetical protein
MDNITTLARGTHVPTRTRMILIVAGDRNPVYLRDMGTSIFVGNRHYSTPRADLRFLSKQEERRFNRQSANPADWTGVSVLEGEDARTEALDLARTAANPAVASAIRSIVR